MIAYNQRSLVLGPTRSGKSELLNAQFTQLRCQKVLYDSKSEWIVQGVEPTRDVDAIDWSQPVIHFEPGEDTKGDAERFFREAFARPVPLVVAVHEASDLCDYQAQAARPPVHRYARQGGAHGKGLLAASQGPVYMPVSMRTEPEHVIVFVPGLAERDHMSAAAQAMQVPLAQLEDAIAQLHQSHGQYSFVYYQRDTREMMFCPPLPEHLRRRTIVTRRPGVT